MLTLAIETATAACSVALFDGPDLIAERHEIVGRGHAERLVPAIGELIAEAGRRPGAILVDCGPGSFTGVRVGLAAARGLGLAWGVPVAGFSALALLAVEAGDVATVAVAIPGGHGELFVQRFACRPLAPLTDLASLLPADAAVAMVDDRVIGPAAPALVAARGAGEALDRWPRAADARLLPEALRTLPPSPIYGRAPDAKLPGGVAA
ncbi:tRNA (adenosine(37)-N6)-threonylcarbamoyltransferase complex dimerization subunit type 1 TsaB [Sphingomonas naphthae]|uniref:tRNA (Adenosine(37)-N6)-threonylcarbamoyltransferase complex dimerization subunit type 1 TsaB n=1 Tax=Sphingomonas naphthae TaxID=1813468 RepID=A0ABY7TGI5_9SPHN|nr:tRNA (adenosine(37)-N6)-threonylcarbamoyltransferase complex dimerization subunit type 1 TsaB [Sphingomonas naphthae]WCT72275.1 tRNA (adenosine(37)-N6)-threonylcarbamoyltransferase complex dimerization subunit type 1 TsaB [Sphingomonas naphthae]